MKQRMITLLLLGAMVAVLSLSEQAAQAVRQGLQLCASSVIPALFPFLVLSGLLTALGSTDLLGRPLQRLLQRLFGCSPQGVNVFLLGLLGGYPLGARMIGQLLHERRLAAEEAQRLLRFCNNAGPAFILGLVGLGRFGRLSVGVWLYAIHVSAAVCIGLFLRKKREDAPPPLPAPPPKSFSAALVDSVCAAGGSMVQICSFVVFFITLLHLFSSLSGIHHPLVLGIIELTNGILQLNDSRSGFWMAAALLGWGGLSVHFQTAAVLPRQEIHFLPYFYTKCVHALLSFLLAVPISFFLFPN